MRVMVTGSRTWRDHEPIHAALDAVLAEHPDMRLVHGACAEGADAMADRWNTLRRLPEPERHPAEWRRYGRAAGPIRNKTMVESRPDLVLAFIARKPDGQWSSGASQTADLAEEYGIETLRWWAP